MRFIGIDPGGTTGLCIKIKDNFIREEWTTVSPDDYLAFYARLSRAAVGDDVTLITERFNFRHEERDRDKIVYTSAEVIGVVKLWHAQHEGSVLELQMAAEGKGFWDNDKLRTVGLYLPGLPHAMDATRHVLHHITFTPPKDYTYIHKLKKHEHDEMRLNQVRQWDKT